MATLYWVGGTGTWSGDGDSTHWSTSSGGSGGGGAPTDTTDVVINGSSGSGTITIDDDGSSDPIDCKSLTCTGYTGTLTFNFDLYVHGSVVLGSGMTLTGSNSFNLIIRNAVSSFTSNGKTIPCNLMNLGGTLTLQDDMVCTYQIYSEDVSFNFNNKNVTCFNFSLANTQTRTITMGSGTLTLTGTGTVWNVNATGLTLNANTSTIKLTNTSNTACTFAGAGKTYANLWFSRGASTATNVITGTNTFTDIKDDGTGTHGLTLPNATTTCTTFHVSGTSGHLITMSATSTISVASGIVSVDYLDLSNSTATGGATFYAGANSTNSGSNSGWIFTAPPSGNTMGVLLGF